MRIYEVRRLRPAFDGSEDVTANLAQRGYVLPLVQDRIVRCV
jgi:hypothetical protein